MRTGRPVRNRGGMTLIWFVASVSLILIAMTLSLSSFYACGRVILAAKSTTAASSVAEGELERLRALPFEAVRSGGLAVPAELARVLPDGHGDVLVQSVDASLKKVTVTVQWTQDRERVRRVRLVTLIARELEGPQ